MSLIREINFKNQGPAAYVQFRRGLAVETTRFCSLSLRTYYCVARTE